MSFENGPANEEKNDSGVESSDGRDSDNYLRIWGLLSWAIFVMFALAIFFGFTDSSAHLRVDVRLLAAFALALLWHGARGVSGEAKRMYLFGIPAYVFTLILSSYLTLPANLLIMFASLLGLYFAWNGYHAV